MKRINKNYIGLSIIGCLIIIWQIIADYYAVQILGAVLLYIYLIARLYIHQDMGQSDVYQRGDDLQGVD